MNPVRQNNGNVNGARCDSKAPAAIIALALFVIAAVGAAGKFAGPKFGWTALGLGGGMLVLSLLPGNFKGRVPSLAITMLVAAVVITVGALGGTGVLSARQVSKGLFGTIGCSIPLQAAAAKCEGSK